MEKKYNFNDQQPALKEQWVKDKIYQFPKEGDGPVYSIDTPPPTVSGALHIGHIFSYTHTDFIARYQRMSNARVFYPFGFDDNGLPTEKYIEKKCKTSAYKLGRSGFIDLCLKEGKPVEQEFQELWQVMGLSVDWNLKYETISETVRKISQESFIRLLEKDYIYRKYEPALYCTACRTSVAQAELDDVEQDSKFYTLTFKTKNGQDLKIATTRPELLSSCVAMFYHPDDARYKELQGQEAIVPLFGNSVPILADELVQPDKGTGLVMCCTFGDKNDVEWYKTHKLDHKQSIGLDGKWMESTGFLAGLRAKEARDAVVEKLEQENIITDVKPVSHTVNTHERCKREIEYAMLSQWFLKILPYKQEFLAQADKINWHPSYMKSRFVNWVENLNWDWCLSRQRFYGIPFPVWHCTDCSEIILPKIDELPIDPQEAKPSIDACSKCNSTNIVADTDVMDTWNTSSLTPQICYSLFNPDASSAFDKESLETFIPMSMRPQAHDIIRTWAFYTIIKSWMHLGSIPWKDIVISGHVLSGNKEKLSKSKGNASMTPENLLKQWPADAIRYWTACGALGTDVAFSENQLKIGNKLVTKLWNAFAFVNQHTEGQTFGSKPDNLGTVNEWMLNNVTECFERYDKEFKKFEYGAALNQVEHLFWHDFCDNYLELVKDQFFNPDNYDPAFVQATLWTLHTVGLRILQLYAAFIPFVTDAIYRDVYSSTIDAPSIHSTIYSNLQVPLLNPASAERMTSILDIVSKVRKIKSENQLSLKTEL
ncbi:MAG TPA: valine--tRNA ligase, partial [Candidatus Babeliales bacterium]|nr:valine--tRNA ligase [Candidatus Babeliales bacterium]